MGIGIGICLPLLGTFLGATFVLLLSKKMIGKIEHYLIGCASGVMVAASIWSLILPAIEQSEQMGHFAFLPAVIGICIGCVVIILLEKIVEKRKEQSCAKCVKGVLDSRERRIGMLLLAVTLHNIPEGMAVGVGFIGAMESQSSMTMSGAMMLSLGIAIQNIPEGAIISMPLWELGKMTKKKAVLIGVLTGVVEPVCSLVTIACGPFLEHILPYMLSLAAGAMLYVVVDELIPNGRTESCQKEISAKGVTLGFMVGFLLMLTLDVGLG